MLTHRIRSATRKDDIGASLCQIGRERNSQELRIRTARDSQALFSSPPPSFHVTSSVRVTFVQMPWWDALDVQLATSLDSLEDHPS